MTEKILHQRRAVWDFYYENLRDWADRRGSRLPTVPGQCEQSYHMFYIVMQSHEQRDGLITHLRNNGINSVFHYQPLHLSEMGEKFGGKIGDCPVTEYVAPRLLRLPFYNQMTPEQLELVV